MKTILLKDLEINFLEKLSSIQQNQKSLNEFEQIQKAAQKVFPKKLQVATAFPTAEGLLLWSLNLIRRSYIVKFYEGNPIQAELMEDVGIIIERYVYDTTPHSNTIRTQLKLFIEFIFTKNFKRFPDGYKKHYLIYSDKIILNLLNILKPYYVEETNGYKYSCDKIHPQMLAKAFYEAFPKSFLPIRKPSHRKEVEDWGKRLLIRSKNQSDKKRHSRMFVAGHLIYDSVVFFQKRTLDYSEDTKFAWSFCPLCWRTVENSKEKDKCKIHKSGTKKYQRIMRLDLPKNKCFAWQKIADRIPVEKVPLCQKKVYCALSTGFPQGWNFLPNIKHYLLKKIPEGKNPESILSCLDDCIEILSPGALEIFDKNPFVPTAFYGPYIPKKYRDEIYETDPGAKESLLTRAEAWLSVTSKIKWGGARHNSGIKAETGQERWDRFKKNSIDLKEKRSKRKNNQH